MADNNQFLNVQPHSEEAELAVLGSMLSSKDAVSKSIQWLSPDVFYKAAHGKIFSAKYAALLDTLSSILFLNIYFMLYNLILIQF